MSEPAKLSYTINEAAAAIGVSRRTIYAMIEREELTAFKWCGRTLIRADVLRECIRRIAEPPAPVETAEAPTPTCGVYMLMLGEKVVYVGRSMKMRSRLSEHRRSGRAFDEVRAIECSAEIAIWLEKELVRVLQPAQNLVRYHRQARSTERRLRGLSLQ